MRRAAAVVLGTLAGTALMVGAKLGTPGPDTATDDPGTTAVVVGGPTDGSPAATVKGTPKPRTGPTPTASGTGKPKPTPDPTPTATRSGPADGTYTASAPVKGGRYGTLSMTVTISGHRISSISAGETGESQCYHRACPTLTSEALSAQSADIHSVSGATYSSAAYRSALQAVLDRANA